MHKALGDFICFPFSLSLSPSFQLLPSPGQPEMSSTRLGPAEVVGRARGLRTKGDSAAAGWFQHGLLASQTKDQCPGLKQHLFEVTCH